MDCIEKITLRENLKIHPKAKPLAERLVAEAARQEVSLSELRLAAKIAVTMYEQAMNPASMCVKGFESDAKATLESI